MNDHDLITAMRESFADVRSATPVEQIVRRSRMIRGRRRMSGAVAVAAVAAAAGTAVALVPSGVPGPAAVATQTTAYVVSHVARALEAMPDDTVWVTRQTTDPATSPVIEIWGNQAGQNRLENFTLAGRPISESGTTFSGPITRLTRTVTIIDYQNRTWWRTSSFYGNGNTPATVWTCGNVKTNEISGNPAEMAAWLHTALSCGDLKAVGSGPVNGVPTVKLSGYFSGSGTLTYWVNTTTYLPFRFTSASSGPLFRMDLQWLPSTPANLAKVSVSVPAGFTRVPPPGN